jgi:hypothetical protein
MDANVEIDPRPTIFLTKNEIAEAEASGVKDPKARSVSF